MRTRRMSNRFTSWLVAVLLLALGPVGAAWAQVSVTAADPSSAPQGTVSLDVTISGNGFDSSAAVTFLVSGTSDTGGITVKKVLVRGSKKLVATIDVADSAVVNKFDIEVTLSSGRKGKGTTLFTVIAKTNGDPCAAPDLDFPAFTYWQSSGTTMQGYVADATGSCSRPLFRAADGFSPQHAAFSYPVDGSANMGRIVWREGSQIVGGEFTVSGTTVTIGQRSTIYSPVGCCALELSPGGEYLYVSTTDATLERIAVADPSDRTLIKTMPDDGWFANPSVNGDGSALYIDETRMSGSSGVTARQLIRIDLVTSESTVLVPDNISQFWPAADPDSNLIAYTYYVSGTNNCYLLQIADGTTGNLVSYGQPRYGRESTWYRGKVLTYQYTPSRNGTRCSATESISEVDPLTSAETVLTRGYYPDAR
jgi:hypothetical protein